MSRADRRRRRQAEFRAVFGPSAEAALDLLEVVEPAWHDCYGEPSPPDDVVADLLVVSGGTVEGLARAARTAVVDRRDLRVAADHVRSTT